MLRKVNQLKRKQLVVTLLSGLSFLVLGCHVTASADANQDPTIANVVFKPTSELNLTNYVYDTVDPKSTRFHQYLTPNEFAEKFGQSDNYITGFQKYLAKHHVKSFAYRGNLSLKVYGTRQNVNRAFNAKYVKEKGQECKTTYRLPGYLSKQVVAVMGLDQAKPNHKKPAKLKSHQKAAVDQFQAAATEGSIAANGNKPDITSFGNRFSKKYGGLKFANQYQLNQLYDKGLAGQGQRIGIISSSDFYNRDLKVYWHQAGVDNNLGRIHRIYTADNRKNIQRRLNLAMTSPQIEATLDVQMASSVAPKADVDCYIGDNGDDITTSATAHYMSFMQAISDNIDKQLSTSFAPTIELKSQWHDHSLTMAQYNHAFNLMLEQAAAQGITVFRASGDSGASERASSKENHAFSTSPYQVIVGGTTLPYTKIVNGKVITVSKERAWGNTDGASSAEIKSGHFSGSGGGFSALNETPRYQQGVSGINTFRAITLLNYHPTTSKYTINKDPNIITGTGTGRNLPDVAGNADIQTGYATYFSGNEASFETGKIHSVFKKYWIMSGGTSYTSPQMAAANAVMNSGRKIPIGFWNPQIYQFAQQSDSPFNALDSPDSNNLYFTGQPGKLYNQAAGLGTINFGKLYNKFNDQSRSN